MPSIDLRQLAFAVLLLLASIRSYGATWPVEIDGQPVEATWYALSDKPDTLAIGDVLYVGNRKGGMWLCVRDTVNLSFVNHLDTEALLYRKVGEKMAQVGFSNTDYQPPKQLTEKKEQLEEKDDETDSTPEPKLSELSSSVVAGLWGVEINWDEEPALALKYVRPAETFCAIRHMTGPKGPKFSAPFAFRYLKLDWSEALDDSLYALFAPGLIFLEFSLNGEVGRSLDASRLANASDLRILSYSFSKFAHQEALAGLTQLRYLALRYADKLTTAPWLSKMTELRAADFSQTSLADLSPFQNLQHIEQINLSGTPIKQLIALQKLPRLETLYLEFSAIEELPIKGLEKIRHVAAFGTTLQVSNLTEFRAAHPQCKVQYEWKPGLLDAVKDTDRLVVRSGGTCHRNPDQEKILFETKSLEEIRELLELIDIDESKSNSACMCCGYPTLEFYQGTKLLTMVGVQHGRALRWGPWPADGRLTAKSTDGFGQWMTKNSIPRSED